MGPRRTRQVGAVMRYLLILIALALSGCGTLRQQAHTATGADVVTTYVGVFATERLSEVNPLIASPTALLVSAAVRIAGVEYINTMPEPARTASLATFNSVSWAVVANNLCALAGFEPIMSLTCGAATGIWLWHKSEPERQFAAICADEKTRNPALKCVFNKG